MSTDWLATPFLRILAEPPVKDEPVPERSIVALVTTVEPSLPGSKRRHEPFDHFSAAQAIELTLVEPLGLDREGARRIGRDGVGQSLLSGSTSALQHFTEREGWASPEPSCSFLRRSRRRGCPCRHWPSR